MGNDGTQQRTTNTFTPPPSPAVILGYYIWLTAVLVGRGKSNNYITIMPWNLAVKKIRAALGLLTVMLLVKPSG
jgi:hypothetical protein